MNGFQYDVCQSFWIINHDTAKPDVHGWRSSRQKSAQLQWWLIRKWFPKKEPTNVFGWSALETNWTDDSHIPMCCGQSAGLGTSAGDQQYVCGTSSVSNNNGPSELGTGSRSSDFRHLLTISPILLGCQRMRLER